MDNFVRLNLQFQNYGSYLLSFTKSRLFGVKSYSLNISNN